jgi:hypothetical protein
MPWLGAGFPPQDLESKPRGLLARFIIVEVTFSPNHHSTIAPYSSTTAT